LSAARQRQDLLVVLDAGDIENYLCRFRRGNKLCRADAFQRAPEVRRERLCGGRVEEQGVEAVMRFAAQMKAASDECAREDEPDCQSGDGRSECGLVVPATAGNQCLRRGRRWIPTCAGMTAQPLARHGRPWATARREYRRIAPHSPAVPTVRV